LRRVRPEKLAGLHVDGEHVVVAGDGIEHAFVEQQLRLLRIAGPDTGAVQADAPDGLHVPDVAAIDLIEPRIALVVDVAAVRDPVARR
jgi:hypothetical protein